MTPQEFDTFVKLHEGNFPGFLKWFYGRDRQEAPESSQMRLQSWVHGLKPFALDEAQFASMELLYTSEKPEGFTHHLAWLREAIIRFRGVKRGNAPVNRGSWRCRRCKHTGQVYALPKEGHHFRTQSGLPIPHMRPVVVDCDCEFAVPVNTPGRPPRWDAETMMELPEPDLEDSAQIIANLRANDEHAKANAYERFLRGGAPPMPVPAIEHEA